MDQTAKVGRGVVVKVEKKLQDAVNNNQSAVSRNKCLLDDVYKP